MNWALLPLNILWLIIGGLFLTAIIKSIKIIPNKSAKVIERLGKYHTTLGAGIHMLIPFIDKVRYTHNLKEQAIDVPTQPCFTNDNVRIEVDGVLYFKVVEPKRASYGITDYRYGTIQLAQTTMRSVIGKLELDKTFEERENINGAILKNIDEATDPWGVRITRYEIQNIRVPDDILNAMEVQMRSERDKRAIVARSLGEMESRINSSSGERDEAINRSEGEKEKRINEAEGRAAEIRSLAKATATSIARIAEAIEQDGGEDALVLRISEGYIEELSKLAQKDTRLILPMDLTNINSVLETVNAMVQRNKRLGSEDMSGKR
ncbi:MAG: paraslipin [Spirochaetaceae bacterium]|nr:MAG: paraslipin [Spirochaetaceae bacterium]